MSKPFPRWARFRCRHPDAYVIRSAGGRVLRDVCPTCCAELGAVAFDTPEDALNALRDAALSARTDAAAGNEWSDYRHAPFDLVATLREMTSSSPTDRTEPYDVSMPAEVLEMLPRE